MMFFKAFYNHAIYLSDKVWLKLTIFNPKTRWEKIMCWFHESWLDKYIWLIKKQEINVIILKQNRNKVWEIVREIYKIFEYQKNFKIPSYTKKQVEIIKEKYYKQVIFKQTKTKIKAKETENKQLTIKENSMNNIKTNNLIKQENNQKNIIESDFIENFKNTDFKDKTYYEIVEYIVNWKRILTKTKV